MSSSETKVWLIAGCSSGFGRCITEHALKMGDKVVATLRTPDTLSELAEKHPETLLVLRLDVTKPDDVTGAFVASKSKFGRVDVVVNNAGQSITSEVEGTNYSDARAVFEVNFWGASHVSKEAVRFFREENRPMGGRLLQLSSIEGITAGAAVGYYCASKFGKSSTRSTSPMKPNGRWVALEGLSECLAREVHPDRNIKVTIFKPGPFFTKIIRENEITTTHPAHTDPSLPSVQWRSLAADPSKTWNGDPTKFAEAAYNAAYLKDPPLRLPIHPIALAVLREKGNHLLDTTKKWGSWSEGVLRTDCCAEVCFFLGIAYITCCKY